MKISILTATYNRANLLPRLYESILENNKTYSNFEWLIMDDGSKDNTKEIVTNWQNDNKIDIKYYYQENAGKMESRRPDAESGRTVTITEKPRLFCNAQDKI